MYSVANCPFYLFVSALIVFACTPPRQRIHNQRTTKSATCGTPDHFRFKLCRRDSGTCHIPHCHSSKRIDESPRDCSADNSGMPLDQRLRFFTCGLLFLDVSTLLVDSKTDVGRVEGAKAYCPGVVFEFLFKAPFLFCLRQFH